MPLPRYRTLVLPDFTGYVTNLYGGAPSPRTVGTGNSLTVDIVGDKANDHPFSAEHYTLNPGWLSGQATVFPVFHFDEYPFGNQDQAMSHLSVADSGGHTSPSSAEAATSVIAATNPSRPDVSVPNFLLELREIPEALHRKGQRYASKPHSSAVEFNFGWDLLFKDVRKMIDYTSSVNNRVKELNSLYSSGGLRRRRNLFNGKARTVLENEYFHSFEVAVGGSVLKTTSKKVWVTVRWEPDASVPIPSADELISLARRVVHGWSLDSGNIGSVIWEAIPWSWFSDYFFNIGAFLNASRNSVGAIPRCCVMEETISRNLQRIEFISDGISANPSSSTYISRTRTLGVAEITATQPFLTTKQLTTLSSIILGLT